MYLLPLLLLLVSCGYHFPEDSIAPRVLTISVPYVAGDWDGSLTSAIIEQISRTGCYTYQREGGALLLKVEEVDDVHRNIGYRYDRNSKGKRRNSIIPTETRLVSTFQVTLVEAGSGTALLGPVNLTAQVDFDHDYESPLNSVNIRSLGQLSDYDDALEAAQKPLNQALAQKIVDFICDSW